MINTLREWWFLWRAWRRSRKAHRYLNVYLSDKESAEQRAREAWEDYIDRTPRRGPSRFSDRYWPPDGWREGSKPSKNPPRETDWDYFDARNQREGRSDVERGGEAVRPSKNPPREKL